jgi:hypothetical protein
MQKEFLVSIIAATLLSVTVLQAYAVNITGNVKSGGSGLGDAKVTAEKVNEYAWTRSATSGTVGSYTLSVGSTNSYTVAASKQGYTRASTTVNGGSAAPDLNLSTRSNTVIMFKIAYDTSVGSQLTIDQARFYLYSAEPWFLDEHSIDFQEAGSGTAWLSDPWVSGNDCLNFRDDMKTDVNWNTGNYGIAEILIGFTGKSFGVGYGCISNPLPTGPGQHPYITISNFSPDMARSVMHEVSHAYGLQHISSCTNVIPGIMASVCGESSGLYIKNWEPSNDSLIETNRSWY